MSQGIFRAFFLNPSNLAKPDLWPLFAVCGAGVGLAGYFGGNTMRNHADVCIDKSAPMPFLRKKDDRGQKFQTGNLEQMKKHSGLIMTPTYHNV